MGWSSNSDSDIYDQEKIKTDAIVTKIVLKEKLNRKKNQKGKRKGEHKHK